MSCVHEFGIINFGAIVLDLCVVVSLLMWTVSYEQFQYTNKGINFGRENDNNFEPNSSLKKLKLI